MCGVIPINGYGCTGAGRHVRRDSRHFTEVSSFKFRTPECLGNWKLEAAFGLETRNWKLETKFMPHTLRDLAEFTTARLIGDGNIQVTKVASIAQARPGDLVFVQDERDLPEALDCSATAVIAGEFAAASPATKPLLIAENPRLTFCRAGALLHPPKTYPAGAHPTAVVHPSAVIAPSAAIDAHAVIGANVSIGERVHIGANCSISDGVGIGDDCDLFPCVVIYSGTILGRRVVVHAGTVLGSDGFGFVRDEAYGRYQKFPQIGQLVIGDYVEIGANCTIDRGALEKTVIGSGTKLDNLVHIGHNDIVGSNVVIAAQTGISGSSEVGDDCVIGGQVGIGDHAKVEAGTMLGGQAGILPHKVFRGSGKLFWGTPARPLAQYLKELAAVTRLAKNEKSQAVKIKSSAESSELEAKS
jgi:UDP-3-O-[3-hydroxymyristoyl] glucosamine N-acyltransferase